MKVNYNQKSPSFQQIKLTRRESVQVSNLLKTFRTAKKDGIFEQLTDIFSPKFEKEAETTFKNKNSQRDFLQELYITLFETFAKSQEKNHPVAMLVNKLNEIKLRRDFVPSKHISLNKLSDKDKEALSTNLLFSSETKRGFAKRVVETSPLNQKEINILGAHLEGDSYNDIADVYCLTAERINQIYTKAIHTIKLMHNKPYRDEYFRLFPKAEQNLEDRIRNTRHISVSVRELFGAPKSSYFSDAEEIVNKNGKQKSGLPKRNPNIKISDDYPLKKITVKQDKNWSMENNGSFDISVDEGAIFRQSGINDGNVNNQGLYILTGTTNGCVNNSGKFNLRGVVEGEIKNFGKAELSGTANNNISNFDEINISGTVKGNILNYGDLRISGCVKGNIYTYKDVEIADDGVVLGRIFALDDNIITPNNMVKP